MKKKSCVVCGSPWHSKTFCPRIPRKPIQFSAKPIPKESLRSKTKRQILYRAWKKSSPPDENGNWTCYLRISTMCPGVLTPESLTLEHVVPKVKAPELKWEVTNIKPSCAFCNKMKGSRTIEQLARIWPHLLPYCKLDSDV